MFWTLVFVFVASTCLFAQPIQHDLIPSSVLDNLGSEFFHPTKNDQLLFDQVSPRDVSNFNPAQSSYLIAGTRACTVNQTPSTRGFPEKDRETTPYYQMDPNHDPCKEAKHLKKYPGKDVYVTCGGPMIGDSETFPQAVLNCVPGMFIVVVMFCIVFSNFNEKHQKATRQKSHQGHHFPKSFTQYDIVAKNTLTRFVPAFSFLSIPHSFVFLSLLLLTHLLDQPHWYFATNCVEVPPQGPYRIRLKIWTEKAFRKEVENINERLKKQGLPPEHPEEKLQENN